MEILQTVPGVFDFRNYYAIKYQHSHLDGLVARHPDKAETFSIGTSYEGRDMKVRNLYFQLKIAHFIFLNPPLSAVHRFNEIGSYKHRHFLIFQYKI